MTGLLRIVQVPAQRKLQILVAPGNVVASAIAAGEASRSKIAKLCVFCDHFRPEVGDRIGGVVDDLKEPGIVFSGQHIATVLRTYEEQHHKEFRPEFVAKASGRIDEQPIRSRLKNGIETRE